MIILLVVSLPKIAIASKLCFIEAGTHFNIDPLLLRAIAIVESNLDSSAIGINKDSEGKILSHDYGIMQVNQKHIPGLISKGIIKNKQELLDDPCLNIKIGSSILYDHFNKCGMNWQCLGTYNAGFSKKNDQKRLVYARKIYNIYTQLNRLSYSRNTMPKTETEFRVDALS